MRARTIYLLAAGVLLAGIAVAFLAFPARFACDDGAPAFTTSRGEADRVCGAVPEMTGPLVVDHRITSRAAVLAPTFVMFVILLRIGSDRVDEGEP